MKREGRISDWLRCSRVVDRQYSYSKPPSCSASTLNLEELVAEANRCRQRMSVARDKGWQIASVQAAKDYCRILRKLGQRVDSEVAAVKESQTVPFQATRVETIRDLCVLDQEAPDVSFDLKEKLLSVMTADIELGQLRLGAFKVVLHLDSLSRSSPAYYEVVAIEANYAASDDDVTHPHVQGNRLCEGDAQPAIKLALMQGRLLDFFQIVEQVLGTYNAASAYVKIEEWQGHVCDRCGHSAGSDEIGDCDGCGASVCDGCVSKCSLCDGVLCGNCEEACETCGDSVCRSCSMACSQCEEHFCKDCLSEESEKCVECEKKAEETDVAETEAKTETTTAEILADGVGEVIVSA